MPEKQDEFDDDTNDSDDFLSIDGNAGASSRDMRDTDQILRELIQRSRQVLSPPATTAQPAPAALPKQKRRSTHSINIDTDMIETRADGSHVVFMGDAEIWDGADLALLRETFVYLYHQARSRSFGVDMSFVKYAPSGFFGMLCDWREMGVEVRLYAPQPAIANTVWFKQFFTAVGGDGVYVMH